MGSFSESATLRVEIETGEEDSIVGDLTVKVSGRTYRDFKGFYGSQPAYRNECDYEIQDLEWEGRSISMEDLRIKLGAQADAYVDLAVEKALEAA